VKTSYFSNTYRKTLFGPEVAYENYMIFYELYVYDKLKGYELIGILPERRKDPKRITKESVLKWGRMVLGDRADKNSIIFAQTTMDDISGKIFEVNMPQQSV
jgi:hypothetical protein